MIFNIDFSVKQPYPYLIFLGLISILLLCIIYSHFGIN